MREASWRPVRSDDDTLTGAPRCRRMLTLRSRSTPVTGRGEDVLAGGRDERGLSWFLMGVCVCVCVCMLL